ncbi:MAG TPA: hypothetical protein VIS51_10080 [Solirubrobacterales bacterium]
MARTDRRVPAGDRDTLIATPLLDGMEVWLRLAGRRREDCQTYLTDAGLAVVDETDDARLELVLHGDVAMAVLFPELELDAEW